jgi:hypothetical protein
MVDEVARLPKNQATTFGKSYSRNWSLLHPFFGTFLPSCTLIFQKQCSFFSVRMPDSVKFPQTAKHFRQFTYFWNAPTEPCSHLLFALSGIGAFACIDQVLLPPSATTSYNCETVTDKPVEQIVAEVTEIFASVSTEVLGEELLSETFPRLTKEEPSTLFELLFNC